MEIFSRLLYLYNDIDQFYHLIFLQCDIHSHLVYEVSRKRRKNNIVVLITNKILRRDHILSMKHSSTVTYSSYKFILRIPHIIISINWSNFLISANENHNILSNLMFSSFLVRFRPVRSQTNITKGYWVFTTPNLKSVNSMYPGMSFPT